MVEDYNIGLSIVKFFPVQQKYIFYFSTIYKFSVKIFNNQVTKRVFDGILRKETLKDP